MTPDQLRQMCAQNADRVDHRVSLGARALSAVSGAIHMAGIPNAGSLRRRTPSSGCGAAPAGRRMNRQLAILHQLEARDLRALQQHHVFAGFELQIVGDANRRHHVAEVRRHLPPDAGDPAQQRRVLPALDQLHQSQSHFDRQRFHFEQRFEIVLGRRRRPRAPSSFGSGKLFGESSIRRYPTREPSSRNGGSADRETPPSRPGPRRTASAAADC